jgi:hypothetical protein
VRSSLGVRVEGTSREVHIVRPMLPIGIESLTIRALPVGEARIDLNFHRLGDEVVVVPGRHTEAEVKVLTHL